MKIRMNLEAIPEIKELMENEKIQSNKLSKKQRLEIKREKFGEKEQRNESVVRNFKPNTVWPIRTKAEKVEPKKELRYPVLQENASLREILEYAAKKVKSR